MKYVLEKRPFYEKLKSFAGDNYLPVVFSHEFGDDLQYTICFEWSPASVTGARNLMASCQLFDNRVSGFRKYIADDLHFNMIEVGATTDYKLYKFLRDWVQENIERYERIDSVPTVDPETLPIVRKLREELARVTAERDAAICLCGKLIALCSPPKEWVPKLFRRHINRPGDYMGSGYDFLDSFNRIFDNFVETADDEFYTAICGAAEKEILERKQKIAGKKEE